MSAQEAIRLLREVAEQEILAEEEEYEANQYGQIEAINAAAPELPLEEVM